MRRLFEVARGIVAGIVLAAVVVGLPVALAQAVGWPLPRSFPRLDEVADALGGERAPEAATVWKILAAVLWLAWAQVVASVVVEVAAMVRGGLARTLPGLGLAQGMVAPLVTAVALAWPAGPARPAAATPAATAATAGPPTDALAPSPPPPPQTAATPPSDAAVAPAPGPLATVDHVVVRRDTLWDLAERYLGDGYRARELFERNRGRPQPDGSALSDPGLLRPGWVLSIPVEPGAGGATPGQVVVRTGDTLWDLAEEHLGDPRRHAELAEHNAGRAQADGSALTDPDVIEPGWVLELPPTPAPPPPPDRAEPSPPPASGGAGVPAEPPAPTGQPPDQTAPGAGPGSTVPAPPSGANRTPAPSEAQADREGAADDEREAVPVAPLGLIGGGVATAGLVVLLDRRRRAQQRHRSAGRRLPLPAPEVAAAERELRAGAQVDTATTIDVALRAAAAGAGPGALPQLHWVEVAGGGVTLVLDTDAPAPTGFVGDGPGRWRTAINAAALVELAAPASSPAPCLVPVGRDDAGLEVLVDLEAAPVTTVVGEPAQGAALLRAMVTTAASAPWSDHPRVLVVGLDPADLRLPALETGADLDDALAEVEQRADRAQAALRGLDCPGVGAARARGITPDAWEVVVVVSAVAPDEAQRERLSALAARPAGGFAVVVALPAGTSPVGRTVAINPDGTVHVEGMDRPTTARQLDQAAASSVAELLDNATLPAVAAPNEAEPPPRPPQATVRRPSAAVEELLAEVDVLVRVLGPIAAVRLSPEGEEPLVVPKQKSLEAIAYLALREAAADREELQAALWPSGTNSAKTFQNVVWGARKALGRDRDGAELLPDPTDGRYGSNPRLVTDYGLFHELVSRADELDEPGAAAELLAAALTLVRGEPFVGVGRNYAWVAPHAGIIVAQVVDAAEELAEVRLASGDWRGAEWAARQGLRVFPCDERLYRLLMRCAHAAGSVAGVQRVFDELLARVADPDGGVEPVDTVHPETVALLEHLTSTDAARRVNAP